MAKIEDAITTAKDKLPNVTPTPIGFHSQATALELKSRLQWGEPGLTIVDVRDHDAFNECRIKGAITMPMTGDMPMANFQKNAQDRLLPLLPNRDIYVYGASDEETAKAANFLRQAGYQKVAELKGGLKAWREINGTVEGAATNFDPGAGAYNIGARLQEFAQERSKERMMERK